MKNEGPARVTGPAKRRPWNLLVALRTLQGVVAGAFLGLALFVALVRFGGLRVASKEEGGGLLLAFFLLVAAGVVAGALLGAALGRRPFENNAGKH